jgi:hypothetical protein
MPLNCRILKLYTHKPQKHPEWDYKPSEELVKHLTKRLQIEKKHDEIKHAGGKLSLEDERERDNLISEKVRILDKYVFRSMANIVTFFEMCMDPLARKIFEDDIQELLLGANKSNKEILQCKRKNSRDLPLLLMPLRYEPIFHRLTNAILSLSSPTESLTEQTDFRLILLDILQWEIYQIFSSASTYMLRDSTIVNNVVEPDIGRAAAWTRYLSTGAYAHRRETELGPEGRPVLF